MRKKATRVKKVTKALDIENTGSCEIREFEGFRGQKFQVLCLEPEKEFKPFGLGYKKLRLVLENLDAVRRYVASEGTEC